MFALARHTVAYDTAVRAGNWELKTGTPMFRMSGKTLGIVGFGKIGQALGAKARGLGMKVIAYSPHLSKETFAAQDTGAVSLDELFTCSDFVSLHLPLNAQTRYTVNSARLKQMKPTAFLINTSRGGVIDQEALAEALKEKWIAGAGLDVFEPERLPADHALLHVPNSDCRAACGVLFRRSGAGFGSEICTECGRCVGGTASRVGGESASAGTATLGAFEISVVATMR